VNDVRIVARASDGTETEDRVAIQFNPAAIRLTSPREGDTIDTGDPPFVIVEERSNPATTAVWVLVNDVRVLAAVRQDASDVQYRCSSRLPASGSRRRTTTP
jgi:hypothetical protein